MRLFHNEVIVWDKFYCDGWSFWGDKYYTTFRVNILTGEIVRVESGGYYPWLLEGWVR